MKQTKVGSLVTGLLASNPDIFDHTSVFDVPPTVINRKYPPNHPVALELIRKSREKNARKKRKNPSHYYGD